MKVLLTGAQGQLGRSLIASTPPNIALELVGRDECNMSDPAAIVSLMTRLRPDVVINAAAYTSVDKAETDEHLARAVNSDAVAVLAASGPDKIIHVSTDFVFDGQSGRAYKPHDPLNPLSVYGRTKADGESELRAEDLLVRTSWLYAAYGENFVRTMLRLMKQESELRVVADQIGAPTWAPGLAQVIWNLLQHDASGIFHHCDAGVASWYDFAVAIQEEALLLGILDRQISIIPVTTREYPAPANRPAFSLLDTTRTRKLLGDRTPHWRVNLRKMLRDEVGHG